MSRNGKPPSEYPNSYYVASANAFVERPPLHGEARCDVCVVGGGFTGLSAALELRARGYDVIVLEAKRVGWGASGRNGGQICTGYNHDTSQIADWMDPAAASALWDLSEEAKALLRQRVQDHLIDCDLKWGYVFAAMKDRHLRALSETAAEWSGGHGYEGHRLLDRAELREYVDSPLYVGGLYDPGGGGLHPLNYALGLATAAEREGARVHEMSPVTEITPGEHPRLITPHGTVVARHALICANAFTGGVLPELKARIMPVETYVIATEPLGAEGANSIIPSDAAVADCNVVLDYYRLSADRRLIFGGGARYSMLRPVGVEQAMRRAMESVFPRIRGVGIDYLWDGVVAITQERLPDIGRLPGNLFYAQGFSGHGVALTGLVGRLMAEAVAGTAERFDLFAAMPTTPFPGGEMLRTPLLVAGRWWYRLRDRLT